MKKKQSKHYRFEIYQRLYENIDRLKSAARKSAEELGLDKISGASGEIGLYPGSSSCPGGMPSYVLNEVIAANKGPVKPVRHYQKQLRYLIKSIYGDSYEGVVLNTCESVLRAVNEVIFAPPTMRKGDAYRARVLMPFNEDFEYLGAYGRPFPPMYKGLSSDRSVSAGELAVEGKSLVNLDTLIARYAGARYEVHGIKPQLVPFLQEISVENTIARFRQIADRNAHLLSGFQSIGYDTLGYGHSEKNESGAPLMLSETSALAHEYDLPHFVDCGGGLPVVGYRPEDIDADLMCWSMDKASRTIACGLLVGKEDVMLAIRKACGVAGQRFGDSVSHGKALFSFADPGRDALVSLIAYLTVLRDQPELVTAPIDRFHEILEESLQSFKYKEFLPGIKLTKSYSWGGTELNYQQTWTEGRPGIPISTIEDYLSGTSVIPIATEEMGVAPATVYAGNMFITPGLGTLDDDGALIEDYARLSAQALVRSMEIVCEIAGVGE